MKDKKTAIAVVISIVVVFVLLNGSSFFVKMFSSQDNNTNNTQTQMTQTTSTSDAAQVQSKDVVVGTGDVAQIGKVVTVNYTGVFADGTKFDSSLDAGRTPFSFTLGAGQVIKGWDLGVVGMKVGGKRILVIPPQLGYGSETYGPIPGNSTLIFEVELLSVK